MTMIDIMMNCTDRRGSYIGIIQMKHKLLFEISEDTGNIFLWIGEDISIRFANLTEWKKFANDMLHMTDEISENLGIYNE